MAGGGKNRDKLDLGFMKPAAALCVIAILLYSSSRKILISSLDFKPWGSVPLTQLPVGEGLYNMLIALALVAAYTVAFLAGYYWMQKKKLKFEQDLTVVMAYTLMALLMTYPLIFYYTTHVPGDNVDASKFIWNLWWARKTVTEFRNPFHSDYIFYPLGTTLTFDTYSFAIGLISIPLQLVVGLIATYNTMMLLGVVWSGLGMYKLVEYLTSRRDTAFVCGLAFAFTPYRLAHMLGHLNLVSTQWIPFYVLHFMKAVGKGGRRDSILAAVFLAATAFTELTYVLMLGVFSIIILVQHLRENKTALKSKGFRENIWTFAVASLLLTSPLIYLTSTEYGLYSQTDNYFESVVHSADLLAFITMPSYNPFIGGLFKGLEAKFTSYLSEKIVYVGWSILVLSILAFLKTDKLVKKNYKNVLDISGETALWGITALVFFILSLGPVLHILGIDLIEKPDGNIYLTQENIPMPYTLIMNLPFISMSRAPVRYGIGVSFSLIVLAGYSLKKLSGIKKLKRYLPGLTATLIVFEFLALPYPVVIMPDTQRYVNIGTYPGDVVFHIPDRTAAYLQTIHGKRRVGGIVARKPSKVEDWYNQMTSDMNTIPAINFARKYRIDYFILHRDMIVNEEEVVKQLSGEFGRPIYFDEKLAVFRTDVGS
jgi:hypothetical protein